MIDRDVTDDLGQRLGSGVDTCTPLTGGDIHSAYLATLNDGRQVFVKTSKQTPPELFSVEAASLSWLAGFKALPVPEILGWRDQGANGAGYLALRYCSPVRVPLQKHQAAFGAGLAALHSHKFESAGWQRNVFIGPLSQVNDPADWPEFWANQRLRPMAQRAGRSLDATTQSLIEQVCHECPSVLGDVEHLGPLHGDLWAGNALWTEFGAMLIDPAVYVGDPEVDLAMMALFGGFSDSVWTAYHRVRPRTDGFEVRRALYQLWPLLVHVALFGSAYCKQTTAAARQILAVV